eukprot:COSAG02_NODE_6805_length_3351_cov_3.539668_1_plen_126_part_00
MELSVLQAGSGFNPQAGPEPVQYQWLYAKETQCLGAVRGISQCLLPTPNESNPACSNNSIAIMFQVDSHFCKIKRRYSLISNFSQSALENTTILLCLSEKYNSGRRQGVLRIDLHSPILKYRLVG